MKHVILVIAACLVLAGCASNPGELGESESPVTSESPQASEPEFSQIQTIEQLWMVVGCTDDPGHPSFGMFHGSSDPQVVETATCSPFGLDGIAFFYEVVPETDPIDWLETGRLEFSATDEIFIAGQVVVLTEDAEVAGQLRREYVEYL